MKIGIDFTKYRINEKSNKTNRTSVEKTGDSATVYGADAGVTSKFLENAKTAASYDEYNAELVNEIKSEIKHGTYEINPNAIAKAMLGE